MLLIPLTPFLIRTMVAEIGAERLVPIKECLPDTISYGEIRCVLAVDARSRC